MIVVLENASQRPQLVETDFARSSFTILVYTSRSPVAGVGPFVGEDRRLRRLRGRLFDVDVRLERAARVGGRAAVDLDRGDGVVQTEAGLERVGVDREVRRELDQRDRLAGAVLPVCEQTPDAVQRTDLVGCVELSARGGRCRGAGRQAVGVRRGVDVRAAARRWATRRGAGARRARRSGRESWRRSAATVSGTSGASRAKNETWRSRRAVPLHRHAETVTGRPGGRVHLYRRTVDGDVVEAAAVQPRRDATDLIRRRPEVAGELTGLEVVLVERRRGIALIGEQLLQLGAVRRLEHHLEGEGCRVGELAERGGSRRDKRGQPGNARVDATGEPAATALEGSAIATREIAISAIALDLDRVIQHPCGSAVVRVIVDNCAARFRSAVCGRPATQLKRPTP